MTARLEQLVIEQMTQAEAEAIVGWHYEPPYDFYDASADEEDLGLLLSAEHRAGWAFSVKDADGDLVGFFTFRPEDDDVVVVGLGLRPDLTGRGLGAGFVARGLDFARERLTPDHFRLAVAEFNQRAIAVYERAGFVRTRAFDHETNGAIHPFLELERPCVSDLTALSDEVREALDSGTPVVALETTLVAHGFPAPDGIEVAAESEEAVRAEGAIPATIGVLGGSIRVGLTRDELERFTPDARKLGPRDLAACVVAGDVGATTVGGTLAVARTLGIHFIGTGGIGGVHRGFPSPPDVSADLLALVQSPVVVACSGAKSILDVPATMEYLETLGIPVVGYRTDTLPLFYSAAGGPPLPQRVEDATAAARIAAAHWQLGGCGVVLANPPPESLDVEELIDEAVSEAARQGISSQAVTPFVLARLHEQSGGATRAVNRALIVENARLAAEVAVAYAAL